MNKKKYFDVKVAKRGFIMYGKIGQTQLDWIAEDIPCPNKQQLRELILNREVGADIAMKIEAGFRNVCEVLDCSVCGGVGEVQRLMHPDYWVDL